jgi:hypothetical protein
VKTNDATRLLGIIQRAGQIPGSTSAVEGWLTIAGLRAESFDENLRLTLAYEVVADFRRLLDRVDQNLRQRSAGTSYRSALDRLRIVAHGQYVSGQWDAVSRQFFADQSHTILELMADILPDEPEEGTFEDVQALILQVDQLIKAVDDSDLPAYHKMFARMMLDKLIESLRRSVMLGSRQMYEYGAFLTGLDTDMRAHSHNLNAELADVSPAGQAILDQLRTIVDSTTHWAKSVYYIAGAAAVLTHLGERAMPLLNRLN